MASLEKLQGQIKSAQDLLSVTHTMKSLAAVNINQYEEAADSVIAYNQTVELGFQLLLRHRPSFFELPADYESNRLGAVVFGSDQGMCGQFNEHIVTFALDTMNGMQVAHRERSILSVGVQATNRLLAERQRVEADYRVPNSVDAIASSIQDLLVDIERWRSKQAIDRIVLFYNRPLSETDYEPRMSHLLPLDSTWLQELEARAWPSRMLPTYTMEWRRLFSALLRQFFIVSLHMAFTLSLAAENGSRLAAMQAAEKNVEDHLEALNHEYYRLRQQAITEEILDITAGFEALSSS